MPVVSITDGALFVTN